MEILGTSPVQSQIPLFVERLNFLTIKLHLIHLKTSLSICYWLLYWIPPNCYKNEDLCHNSEKDIETRELWDQNKSPLFVCLQQNLDLFDDLCISCKHIAISLSTLCHRRREKSFAFGSSSQRFLLSSNWWSPPKMPSRSCKIHAATLMQFALSVLFNQILLYSSLDMILISMFQVPSLLLTLPKQGRHTSME